MAPFTKPQGIILGVEGLCEVCGKEDKIGHHIIPVESFGCEAYGWFHLLIKIDAHKLLFGCFPCAYELIFIKSYCHRSLTLSC